MGVTNVPRGTCEHKRHWRKGQRTCLACHASRMREYRKRQARETVVGFADLKQFLDYRNSLIKGFVISAVPGSKQSKQINVKITLWRKASKKSEK